jgi:uncharacterized iron-regulated membrane protein
MTTVDNRRDCGSATVLMITLCFTFLAGSLVWLSRTVDQSLDDRTNAAATALQAARAGAQALDPEAARSGVAVVDPVAARLAAGSTSGVVTLWNLDSGETISRPRHKGEVLTIEFSPNNRFIVSGGKDAFAKSFIARQPLAYVKGNFQQQTVELLRAALVQRTRIRFCRGGRVRTLKSDTSRNH